MRRATPSRRAAPELNRRCETTRGSWPTSLTPPVFTAAGRTLLRAAVEARSSVDVSAADCGPVATAAGWITEVRYSGSDIGQLPRPCGGVTGSDSFSATASASRQQHSASYRVLATRGRAACPCQRGSRLSPCADPRQARPSAVLISVSARASVPCRLIRLVPSRLAPAAAQGVTPVESCAPASGKGMT